MSFSNNIKDEIFNNFSTVRKENLLMAEKFGEELTKTSKKENLKEDFENFLDITKLSLDEIKAILKGAFLVAGYINDPKKSYQFEFIVKSKACAQYLQNILSILDFTPRVIKRKNINSYVIYLKEAEQISSILSLVGASRSKLFFEEIRVEKDVKNAINRTVNCETANLAKTIKSSLVQIKAIEKIKKNNMFDKLDDKLKYTANLRLKYKNESLDYISKKTKNSNYISKSGLKHRLDKIISIADSIKD